MTHDLFSLLRVGFSLQVAFPELAKDAEGSSQPCYGCGHGGEGQDFSSWPHTEQSFPFNAKSCIVM